MNILLIATESVPYSKTGGLADVVHGLARELHAQSHDVRIAIPCYRGLLDRARMREIVSGLRVPLGTYARTANIWKSSHERLSTYLIQHDFFFGRDGLYGYLDDYERFVFFTRATLEMLSTEDFRREEGDWFPQIIQGYDWPTGLIPAWLPYYEGRDSRFAQTRSVLSVYNIGRLGVFGPRVLRVAGQEEIGVLDPVSTGPERVSFLRRGILSADKVVAAFPYPGVENLLPESARDLQSILNSQLEQERLFCIRNAIDYKDYDPSSDARIYACFSEWSLEKRVQNKLALQGELGLEQGEHIPMLGVVSRLIPEKGFDLFPALRESILDSGDVQLVVLADPGDSRYMRMFGQWEKDWETRFGDRTSWMKVFFGFEEQLARRIYAGCDIFLMPSREEPSGIQHFIVMRYGALPVVHQAGVLRSSVREYRAGMALGGYEDQSTGVGFTFEHFNPEGFCEAVGAAIDLYKTDRRTWREIQRLNMRQDFSWYEPARKHVRVYQEALQDERTKVAPGSPSVLDQNEQLLQALLEIDSLPGLARRDVRAMLHQAARLVRDTVEADAVCVWAFRGEQTPSQAPGSLEIQLVSESLDRSKSPERPGLWKSTDGSWETPERLAALEDLLNQGPSHAWKQPADLEMTGICKPIAGLSDSDLARDEGWIDGRSVPTAAHSRVLGRIDVLFRREIQPSEDEWLTYALTALASSFGFRLETIRLKLESDQILDLGSGLLQARSLAETIQVLLELARSLSHADAAWLYLFENGNLVLTEPADATGVSPRMAHLAVETREVAYIADSTSALGYKERLPYRSIMAIPLIDDLSGKVIGVLEIARRQPAAFSRDDERVLSKHLGRQAVIALQTARWHAQRDQSRVEQLRTLAASLVGGGSFHHLLERVVNTTAEVLEAQAASLYLIDEATGRLEILAAAGYHRPLVRQGASYELGEGTTGWIAQTGKTFKANSLDELHTRTPWKGKHARFQNGREPSAFLGIPLKIVDRVSGKERVIGVLKLEDRKEQPPHPRSVFSDEDVRLGEMMANVIATVVYNTQLSEKRLRELGTNLGLLSSALAGSQDMQTLMDNIVNTIAEVLRVDAATLYLADEQSQRLVVHAAYGYQKPLVAAKAFYEWGEGVTGRIAQTNQPFQANILEVLREKGGSKKGKYDDLQGGKRPTSFYGLPLNVIGRDKPIGVLKVESLAERPFISEDVLLIEMMGNVIATVVYNTQLGEKRLRELGTNLGLLSRALGGSQDMQTLMNNIVNTIAEVLRVDAATLYLADEKSQRLVVQAAYGYQKPLVAAKAFYEWGEGVTGRIAQTNKPFWANSLDALRKEGGSKKGKYDDLQGGKRPTSFYGLPLNVIGRDKPIGVLKVESLAERPFISEDVLLIEMMGNVIATVVYNTQLSEKRLRELGTNLGLLSSALAGSQDMQTLMDNIVNTIAEVLRVDAATLYLADEKSQRLVVQAAYGYQKPLVAAKAFYEWGEGVTGRIAQTNQPFQANILEVLREKGGSKKGKYDDLQGGKRPTSFYGLPLNVIGRDKPIGMLKVESLAERPFISEDVLLIEMMGNVIATVVYNAQLDQARLARIVRTLGSMARPREDAARELLTEFAQSPDPGTTGLLAAALSSAVASDGQRTYEEAIALWKADATPEVYAHIASVAQATGVQRRFDLFYQAVRTEGIERARWGDVYEISHLWVNLEEAGGRAEDFEAAVEVFVQALGKACGTEVMQRIALGNWIGLLLDTSHTFENTYLPDNLPFAFHRSGYPQDEDLEDLRHVLERLKDQTRVVLPLWCAKGVIERTREMLRNKLKQPFAIDTVVLGVEQIQRVIGASRPDIELHRAVLSQISLPNISPYVEVGPTSGRIFFGRERDLAQISDGVRKASFAVIGGRRIGKTSILLQLHHVRLPAAGFRTLYHDCSTTPTHDSFLATPIRDWQPEPSSSSRDTFADLFQSPPADKPLILLLDEADKLVPAERAEGWPLCNALRALANTGSAQVVLGGERTLREALHDSSSPLFNLANEILLGPLDFRAVEELVTRPMKQLEIELVDEATIVSHIHGFTSGHPNIVQRLCRRLIERLNEQSTRRITLDDVNAVIEDPTFQENDFLQTYWEAASPLEKIITLVLSQEARTYRLKEVRQLLAEQAHIEPGATATKDALDRLVELRSILRRFKDGYAFAVKAFPRVLSNATTVEDQLEVLVEKYEDTEAQT